MVWMAVSVVIPRCCAKLNKEYYLSSNAPYQPTKKCSECIGMSEVCCNKANKLMAGTEDTTTLIFGLEKRLSRNKRIHRTQYAVYGAVF